MKEIVLKAGRITLGVFLLLLGAISGLIPFVQGWIFGLAGLWLLSKDVPVVKKYHDRIVAWIEEKKKQRHEKKHPPESAVTEQPDAVDPRSSEETLSPPPPPSSPPPPPKPWHPG